VKTASEFSPIVNFSALNCRCLTIEDTAGFGGSRRSLVFTANSRWIQLWKIGVVEIIAINRENG
jgi:hypothetical protein